MAIDPDIYPVLDELEQRLGARIDIQGTRIDEHARHLQTLGAFDSATHAELVAIKRRLEALESTPAPEPEPPAPAPEPEPTTSGTFYGWNDRGTDYRNIVKAGMGLGVVRQFHAHADPSRLSDANVHGTHPIWISFKPTPVSLETPTWAPGMIQGLKARFAKGRPLFVTVWHEPEGNRPSGWSVQRWVKAWQTAQAALFDECVKAQREGYVFRVAPVICDWTFTWADKGGAADWYSADFVKYDVMGWDVYPVGQKADGSNRIARLSTNADYDVKRYADPNRRDTYQYIPKCAELARLRGKPWGSAECGIIAGKEQGGDSLHRYTFEQRAQRLRDITEHLATLENPPLLWTWWIHDSCNTHLWSPPDTWGTAAINDSIASNPPISDLSP